VIITRNCTEDGSIVTSNNHFVDGLSAVKQLITRCLRSVVREDRYDRIKGLDYIILFQNTEIASRHISDELLKIPQITNIVSINMQLNGETLSVKLVVDTVYGAIEYDE